MPAAATTSGIQYATHRDAEDRSIADRKNHKGSPHTNVSHHVTVERIQQALQPINGLGARCPTTPRHGCDSLVLRTARPTCAVSAHHSAPPTVVSASNQEVSIEKWSNLPMSQVPLISTNQSLLFSSCRIVGDVPSSWSNRSKYCMTNHSKEHMGRS